MPTTPRKRHPKPPLVEIDDAVVSDVLAHVAEVGNIADACEASPAKPKPGDVMRHLRAAGLSELLDDARLAYADREASKLARELQRLVKDEISLSDAPTDPQERDLWLSLKKYHRTQQADVMKFLISRMKPSGPKVVQNNDNRSMSGMSPVARAMLGGR